MAVWYNPFTWFGPEESGGHDVLNPSWWGDVIDYINPFDNGGDAKPVKKKPVTMFTDPPGGVAGGKMDLGKYGYGSDSWAPLSAAQLAGPSMSASSGPIGISPEFMSFLDAGTRAQMAPLEAILSSGTAEVQRRAQQQKKLLKKQPGVIKDIGAEQRQAVVDMAKLFGGMVNQQAPFDLGTIGMNKMMGTAPGLTGMQSIEQARLSDVPYLRAAGNQFNAGQQLALNLAYQQAAADIQAKRQADMVQIALAQMSEQGQMGRFNASEANQQARFNAEQQNLMARAEAERQWQMMQLQAEGIGAPQTFGPLAIDPSRGWQIPADRANYLVNKYPKTWGEAQKIVGEAPSLEEAALQLKEWAGTNAERAELASLALRQLTGYQPER